MGNRVSYPIHIKKMAIQMKQGNISVKTIMEELGIKNKSKFRYGYRKIAALINQEYKVNKNSIQRIM